MEITTNAIDGGALRRAMRTPVAARTQAAMPCASTYVGKSFAPAVAAPVMDVSPVCGGDLHRGWHEAQLVVLDRSFGFTTEQNTKFDTNFITRSGPPCRSSV